MLVLVEFKNMYVTFPTSKSSFRSNCDLTSEDILDTSLPYVSHLCKLNRLF